MNRIFPLILLVALTSASQPGVRAESVATNAVVVTPDYLGQLAEQMRTNNPALRSANALTDAATADADAVRTWEDPMLVVGGVAGNEAMRADEGDVIYGLEQKLPLFGKPRLQREAAKAALATESASRDYQFQKLRAELAKAAFRTALAERVVAIGEQDLAWLDTTSQQQENNSRVGQTPLADVLRIQNERSRRQNQLQTDRDLLTQEKVALNRLLNRNELTPWPTLELPAVAGAVVYDTRLVDLALKYEPKTHMQRQQTKQAEAQVAVARRQYYPDVSAGVEVRNYSGDGTFRQEMVTLRMSVPWFNHGQISADVKREQARLSAAQLELANEQAAIREELHLLTIKADAARREALLYRDQIIPRTAATLDNIRAGWQSGQTPFREVLDTHRALLDAQLAYAQAVSEQYQALSELVLCCGLGDLGALQMIGAEPGSAPTQTPPSKN
ncbi:MAG: TolC family protein [Verrucomicrobiales bacterium]|nr:TolC family protein [Verrucomicrobiales bacterium]